MYACGLTHSNRLTTPVTVTGFVMLYMAVEWCAKPGVARGIVPNAIASAISRSFMVLENLPLFLLKELRVINIVLADKFIHLGEIRAQRERARHRPRFHEHVRIFHRGFVLQGIGIGPAEALDDVQRLGVPEP